MDPSMHAHAAISDCIFGDKRWTEIKKYGKICIRNNIVKLELIGEKLMKNILIISSSPRKKGNSQILCEQFKKGAEAKGHQVEIFY